MVHIVWTRVTPLSQIAAIVLFVLVLVLGFWLGMRYEAGKQQPAPAAPVALGEKPIADVTFSCADEKTVRGIFREGEVELLLSDGRHLTVPQAISGSGARYASSDESFVFWNKGNTAFITEEGTTTFADCAVVPLPN